MRQIGIICEYDPLHAGHVYLLRAARAEAGETGCVICLMSGDFTQRGEAAILPPRERAAMALAVGADLVLELPFPYSAASARYFATAGVRALAGVGVDTLAFGSECADEQALLAAAKKTREPSFLAALAAAQTRGNAQAYFELLGDARVLPNDILAIEYLRAILEEGVTMKALPVVRVGAGYHDKDAAAPYPSATALRQKLASGGDIENDLPEAVRPVFRAAISAGRAPADTARLGGAMLAALRVAPREVLLKTAECGGGMGAHLARAAWEATDYASLCRAAATKKYTDARLRRALLYILAGVTREDLLAPPAYLRLLGANEKGRAFLSRTRRTRTIPVVTGASKIKALGERAARAAEFETIADGLFALTLPAPVLPRDLRGAPPVTTAFSQRD